MCCSFHVWFDRSDIFLVCWIGELSLMSFSDPSCVLMLKTPERYWFWVISLPGRTEILIYLLLDSVRYVIAELRPAYSVSHAWEETVAWFNVLVRDYFAGEVILIAWESDLRHRLWGYMAEFTNISKVYFFFNLRIRVKARPYFPKTTSLTENSLLLWRKAMEKHIVWNLLASIKNLR